MSDSWPPGDKPSNPPGTSGSSDHADNSDSAEDSPTTESPMLFTPPGGTAVPIAPERPAPPRAPGTRRGGAPDQPNLAVRLLATLALAAFVTTYVATEVDLVRRHFPGIEPAKYWLPQLRQITLPGLAAALLCAVLAYTLHRLRRR